MVVPESSINNIMGGLESTGGVTLHNHRRKLKQRFETIAKLGQGTYGKVQLGINKETGQEVAIKTIKKCKIETEADLIRIRREIQIMSSLRHPYIIHIYEVFENRDKMVLVMEYAAGGELYDYLSKRKVLEENEARRIFRQIAMAVYYCHKHQICHRDLKLENILLDEQGNAKIADFGLSNVFDKSRLLSTFCGSPLYASPEIVKGIPYYGPEVDCWSLGVLLYTLVYGAMPFDGSNFKRLVRQISAGEYFEPKNPSSASELIGGLLTVAGTERLDIAGVCQHGWMAEEGKVSCYRLAVELAEQEPNRLDLLLALAPHQNQIPTVAEEVAPPVDRPVRSQSLGSLATMQQTSLAPLVPPAAASLVASSPGTPLLPVQPSEKVEAIEPEKQKEKKRERSRSRSRKKESDDEKPRKKSVKTKKKSDSGELDKEDMEKVLEEARKISELISQPTNTEEVMEVREETSKLVESPEVTKAPPEEGTPKTDESPTPTKDKKEVVKKVKKVRKVDKESPSKEKTSKESSPKIKSKSKEEPKVEKPQEEVEKVEEALPSVAKEEEVAMGEQASPVQPEPNQEGQEIAESKEAEPPSPTKIDPVRRKSKVFETAEMFNKSPQDKNQQKKVFLPGVKVSDAKAAFERRSSVVQERRPSDFNLASTVNVNKLVQNELNRDEEKIKKENAVKVISHAISESEMNKASTLPRRKLSKPTLARAEPPEHMVANATVSQIVYPTSTPTPVPPPRPSLVKQDSGPREHIIPIQIEKREDEEAPERPQPASKQASVSSRASMSSRASSSSLGRQDSDSSSATIGTYCEPIRKSPREVIIPIAVEGGGFVTPSLSTLTKMSSVSESEEEVPMHGFGLHSTRRRQVEAADSLSSDDDDDNFEMLTAENLFSTLLSRVRNLTHRLNVDEGRPNFPRLFNHHSIFDSPARRLTETKSFTESDPTPWRRKRGEAASASASTLPRGFSTRSSFRRGFSGEEDRRSGGVGGMNGASGRPPVATRKRSDDKVVEDFLATGKLSSLDRVRSYLESLRQGRDHGWGYERPRRKTSLAEEGRPSREHLRSTASLPGVVENGRPSGVNSEELQEEEEAEIAPSNSQKKTTVKNDTNESRVNKAIKQLRKNSEAFLNEFSESKLLKRAVSLEDVNKADVSRKARASSLRPEQQQEEHPDKGFTKKESPQLKKGGFFDSLSRTKKEERDSKIANLKKLEFGQKSELSTESTPTGDLDDQSMISATDNSDTWSSCDMGERLDLSLEDCVSERIRRKSFYHRFNVPKRHHSYHRSVSNLERKRYY